MGWFKKKKQLSPEKEPIEDDLSEKVEYDIYSSKKDIYTVLGVDVADYSKKRVKDGKKKD